MSDLASKTALVFDHGLALPLALRLAESFGKVYYHTPWANGFPRLNQCIIGDGFESIIRTDYPLDLIGEVDCWVFPDILHSDLQLHLESLGKFVWGARRADTLELRREGFQKFLGHIGLKQAPFEKIVGITNLRVFLKDKENKFIKVSKYRGSFETTHWRSWDEDRCNIDSWAVEFGHAQDMVPFLVFDPIGEELEIGGDTYTVDGKWPSLMLRGDEWKDKSYMAAVTPRDEMPEPIQEVLDAVTLPLATFRARCQWSMELRGEGDDWYFIDPTPRLGLPSTASQISVWSNFPEIIWAGAQGVLVDPEPNGKFTAEVALTMDADKCLWKTCSVPEVLREVMKLGHCCEINGMACFPPDDCHGEYLGWLVAVGNTMKETIDTLLGYAEILPDGVKAKTETLVDLLKEIHSAEDAGIEFSSQKVPEPVSVIKDEPA